MTRAIVREVDGKLVLDDPDALAVVRAVAKHNCRALFDLNLERVAHFRDRVDVLGYNAETIVIVLINVDDGHGVILAEALMPGTNWDEYRSRGETPVARGLAVRAGVQDFVDVVDPDAGAKLRDHHDLAVVVVDHGVVEIFDTEGK